MSAFSAASAANPNGSFQVVEPPSDSVASLCFCPTADFLVATSWDNHLSSDIQVRCWEVIRSGTSLNTMPKAAVIHGQPVLCSAWKDDGTTVFFGGTDKQVIMWPLSGGQPVQQVGMHDSPVTQMAWIPEMNLLVTGSWDKTLRYWDLRQLNPAHVQPLPHECCALDVRHPLMVVGPGDNNLIVYDLNKPQNEYKRITSPLGYTTTCIAAFPDKQGFLVGSNEGMVAVHHLDEAQESKNFSFRCHREGSEIYSVDSLNFHPIYHTFATTGSDGAINFWDKDRRVRIKAMARCSQPIPCSAFNNDGSIFAYAFRCTWSTGGGNQYPYIFLHLPQESEVRCEPQVGFM